MSKREKLNEGDSTVNGRETPCRCAASWAGKSSSVHFFGYESCSRKNPLDRGFILKLTIPIETGNPTWEGSGKVWEGSTGRS